VCENQREELYERDRVDVGPMPPSVCGDGNREGPEQDPERCEDGNLVNGDGCSSLCYVEACEAGINLVQNGSFEVPTIGTGWTHIDSPNAQFKWDVRRRDDRTRTNRFELLRGWNGYTAGSGAQYTELDVDRSVAISQGVPTVVGETYRVSYKFSPRPGEGVNDNHLEARLNEVVKDTVSADGRSLTNNDWTTRTFEFVASEAMSTLRFTDLGESDGVGTFLDSVSFECVPPSTPEPVCGDGHAEGDEQCDGSDGLSGAQCPSGTTGSVSCDSCSIVYNCTPDGGDDDTPPPTGTTRQCNDGVDNDKDGTIDANDPGCSWNPPSSVLRYRSTDNDERNCGNGICENFTGENPISCRPDCAVEGVIEN
jgi:cysteine-rich repeat protein